MTARTLIVDDDADLRCAVRDIVELAGTTVEEAGDGMSALERLHADAFDLVISDVRMPRMGGIELLGKIRELGPGAPLVILMTAEASERQAVEAIKNGAWDYFRKPFDVEELKAAVARALECVRLSRCGSIILASPAMRHLALLVAQVAPRDVTVLLTGESGTGKERVAEAIVAASARASKPFLRFNCAALTAELAEAELFGHSKGAFTGAVRTRPGLFREADGGTILLDEIGELSPLTQAKLLRVLQSGEIRPVGEDRPVRVDVRIIAATHRDLLKLAAQGKFREDLYYRLKVVHLKIPPLRERREDIPALAKHFLAGYAKRFGIGPFHVTRALIDRLNAYPWPGNVRELENALESAAVLAQGNELDLSLLPIREPTAAATPETGSTLDLKDRVDAYERELIEQALETHGNNRSQTARALNVSRGALLAKLKKYPVAQPDERAGESQEHAA